MGTRSFRFFFYTINIRAIAGHTIGHQEGLFVFFQARYVSVGILIINKIIIIKKHH